MGATKNNIVIGILVVIIACLSVSLYRVTRLRRVLYEVSNRVPKQIPLDVFVTGMTEAVEQQEQIRNDIISQNRWLLRHLERTLAILEAESAFTARCLTRSSQALRLPFMVRNPLYAAEPFFYEQKLPGSFEGSFFQCLAASA